MDAGGDGAYGEVKSAFDAIVNRARAEHDWSGRVTFAHPKIGWVRGTGGGGGGEPQLRAGTGVRAVGLACPRLDGRAEAVRGGDHGGAAGEQAVDHLRGD